MKSRKMKCVKRRGGGLIIYPVVRSSSSLPQRQVFFHGRIVHVLLRECLSNPALEYLASRSSGLIRVKMAMQARLPRRLDRPSSLRRRISLT